PHPEHGRRQRAARQGRAAGASLVAQRCLLKEETTKGNRTRPIFARRGRPAEPRAHRAGPGGGPPPRSGAARPPTGRRCGETADCGYPWTEAAAFRDERRPSTPLDRPATGTGIVEEDHDGRADPPRASRATAHPRPG